MPTLIDIHKLAPIALFTGLSDNQLTEVTSVMREKDYPEGGIIIHEGEMGTELFVLLEGEIEITKRLTLYSSGGTDQKDKSLIRLKASDNIFFGEMSMFGQEERSATVVARTAVKLGVLTLEQVSQLSVTDPELGYRIYYNIGQRLAGSLRRANRDILKLTTAFCLALEGK